VFAYAGAVTETLLAFGWQARRDRRKDFILAAALGSV
jgi:hypothetical protein